MTRSLQLLSIERDPQEPRHKTVRVIRELSNHEEVELDGATCHLSEFESWDALMRIVEANYRAIATAAEHAAREAGSRALRGQLGPLLNLTINRALVNLITSFTLYLDHTSTRVSHRFGARSDELKLYTSITSSAFDRSFAYRFMCQLRDYTVHCGFPVTTAQVTGHIAETGEFVHQLECAIDPRALLQSGPSYWRGKVRADLRHCTEPLRVEPILAEAIEELRKVNLALIEQEKPHLHQSARVILGLVQGVFAPNTIPAIGRVIQVEGGVNWELFDLPSQMMSRLGYWRLDG